MYLERRRPAIFGRPLLEAFGSKAVDEFTLGGKLVDAMTCYQMPSADCATASHVAGEEALVGEFVAVGIDDLAKYHIVRLCYGRPDLAGDAASYAACLGFHSAAITNVLLDELVASGILAKGFSQHSARGHYRLTDDGEVRRRLVRLYSFGCEQPARGSLLRLLACRSLKKARKRAMAVGADVRIPVSQCHAESSGRIGLAENRCKDGVAVALQERCSCTVG